MAPCSVPAGFRSSGVTSISSAPANGSTTTIPASSRSGRSSVREPSNMVAIRPGDAGGFRGSVSRRCTRVNPMAPVATGSPSSVTTSTVATAERRPRRKMVVRVETKTGAGSGRIRTDMSEVNVQASGSSSSTTPAATSTRKATMLARNAPWRSSSGRGCNPSRNSPSWISATTPRRAGILKLSSRRSVIGGAGRYRHAPGRHQLSFLWRPVPEGLPPGDEKAIPDKVGGHGPD